MHPVYLCHIWLAIVLEAIHAAYYACPHPGIQRISGKQVVEGSLKVDAISV